MDITIINKHTGLYRIVNGVPRKMVSDEQSVKIKAGREVETEHNWIRRTQPADRLIINRQSWKFGMVDGVMQ